jgi:hypothetical protein
MYNGREKIQFFTLVLCKKGKMGFDFVQVANDCRIMPIFITVELLRRGTFIQGIEAENQP